MVGFDVMSDAIASFLARQNESDFIPDKDKISILKEYCDSLDDVYKDSDIVSISALINEDRSVTVVYECESLFYWKKSKFISDQLIRRSLKTEYYVSNNGNICVRYRFPSCFVEIE